MKFGINWFCIMLLIIPVETAIGAGLERVILEHADTLRSRGEIRSLIGHVRVRRGITIIESNIAVYDTRTGQVTLTGDVVLTEPDRRVLARRMNYNEFSGDFEASQDVDMYYGDSLRIRCDMSRYNETAQTVDLYNNVVIDNLSDGARITGSHGHWNQLEDSGIIDKDPVYRLPDRDRDRPDTLIVISRLLLFNRSEQSALFVGDVVMTQSDMRAESDSLLHLPDSSKTILSGDPIIWRGDDELTGRRVELYFEERNLKRVYVEGEATAISGTIPEDPRYNYLIGETLTLTTINDSTQVIVAEGDAKGEYHVWDEEDLYQGVNMSAADAIELTVVRNKATSIKLSGKSNGTFYPPGDVPEELGLSKLIGQEHKRRASS